MQILKEKVKTIISNKKIGFWAWKTFQFVSWRPIGARHQQANNQPSQCSKQSIEITIH